jgi:hypothetical protein
VDSGVVVVTIFVLFYAVIAWIVRPRNRRKSRRPVALSAATDSPDPPFIERRRASIEPIKRFFRAPPAVISGALR